MNAICSFLLLAIFLSAWYFGPYEEGRILDLTAYEVSEV